MTEPDSNLHFAVLLERILHRWPKSIDVAQLHVDEERPDLDAVTGLGVLCDSIAEKLDGESDAVLLMALCDAIAWNVRSAARFCTEIKPELLRPDVVRESFEGRLRRAVTNPDLGWRDQDVWLVERYFSVNT